MGSEGQQIFHTLTDTGDNLASAINALKEHFIPTVNMVVECHAFGKRVQGAQESIAQCIATLRELAATGKFSNSDDMIGDQLVEHLAHPHITERLLLKGNLTLAEAITIATQVESAGQQAKSMAGDQHLSAYVVQTDVV